MGTADEDGLLKFISCNTQHQSLTDYFVLEKMADVYEVLPKVIHGKYYHNGAMIKVSFRR